MPGFKFNLERSQYFNGRSKLLASNGVPKLSDAKANLGDTLAKVVFEQCEEALKADFGLKVPLKGPGDILWVSPSDLLIGKMALKPPFTPKCLQALTHKGILEIGVDLENKFKDEMELQKQKTLEKYKTELMATVEGRMKSEIKDVEIRERLTCHIEMEKQQQLFDHILQVELDSLECKIREQYNEIMSNDKKELNRKWEEQLQEEIKNTVETTTKAFTAQMEEQEEKLTNAFQLELRKKEILRDFDAKLHKSRMREVLKTFKHNLECTNMVNMMYILCMERRKCCEKKKEIESYYKKVISNHEETISKKDKKITKLLSEKDHQIQEVQVREICLREVIKHFQKFVNFALRAAPMQAEFLLSVKKMMTFELTNAIAKSDFPDATEEQLVMPWQNVSETIIPSVSSNLEIGDYHDCLNERNPPTPRNGSEMGKDYDLPAFYFKDQMYVREDFRDMLSTGLKITPSNELWNRDVEFMVATWMNLSGDDEATKKVEAELPKKESSEVSVGKNERPSITISTEKRRSLKSTVQFIDLVNQSEISNVDEKSEDSKRTSRRSSLSPSLPFAQMPIPEPTVLTVRSTSKILAAKDSLEVLIEKRQKSGLISTLPIEQVETNLEPTKKGKELGVETRDSVILMKTSLAKQSLNDFNLSPRDSIELAKTSLEKAYGVRSKPSKLTLARNSVELLKASLFKLKEPASICKKKEEQARSSPTSPTLAFSKTCCERCKRREEALEPIKAEQRTENISSFSDERSVKISRIQIINLDEHITAPSVVSFHEEPKIVASTTSGESRDVTKGPRKNIFKLKTKKTTKNQYVPKLKVMGDENAKEGEQNYQEFTADRIRSLIDLMKEHPQLMQLFTGGSR